MTMDGLQKRLHQFSMIVLRLFRALPRHRVAYVLGDQFMRAGLSPGAHFREALRARSKAEYVSKLNGAVMELVETDYWLELMVSNDIVREDQAAPIADEAGQLTAIFTSLMKKWKPR